LTVLTYANQPAGFSNKAIDSAVTLEPYLTTVLSLGDAEALSYFGDEIEPTQISVLSYSPQFAANRRDAAERFAAGVLEGQRAYMDAMERGVNREQVVAVLAEKMSVKPEDVAKGAISSLSRTGVPLTDSLRRQQRFFVSRGLLDKEGDVDSLVDNSFMTKANAELGP
jgi:NitT/TauT family transport system substrate-binding protein